METVNKDLILLLETPEYNLKLTTQVVEKIFEELYIKDEHTLIIHVGKLGREHIEKFLTELGIKGERQMKNTSKELTIYDMIGDCVLILLVDLKL